MVALPGYSIRAVGSHQEYVGKGIGINQNYIYIYNICNYEWTLAIYIYKYKHNIIKIHNWHIHDNILRNKSLIFVSKNMRIYIYICYIPKYIIIKCIYIYIHIKTKYSTKLGSSNLTTWLNILKCSGNGERVITCRPAWQFNKNPSLTAFTCPWIITFDHSDIDIGIDFNLVIEPTPLEE